MKILYLFIAIAKDKATAIIVAIRLYGNIWKYMMTCLPDYTVIWVWNEWMNEWIHFQF